MTLNSIKNRVEKLSKSKRKRVHVFTIHESDKTEVKEKIQQEIEVLKSQGEDPLLIVIRTLKGPLDVKNEKSIEPVLT